MFNQTEFMKKYLALALDNLNGAKNGSYNFTEEELMEFQQQVVNFYNLVSYENSYILKNEKILRDAFLNGRFIFDKLMVGTNIYRESENNDRNIKKMQVGETLEKDVPSNDEFTSIKQTIIYEKTPNSLNKYVKVEPYDGGYRVFKNMNFDSIKKSLEDVKEISEDKFSIIQDGQEVIIERCKNGVNFVISEQDQNPFFERHFRFFVKGREIKDFSQTNFSKLFYEMRTAEAHHSIYNYCNGAAFGGKVFDMGTKVALLSNRWHEKLSKMIAGPFKGTGRNLKLAYIPRGAKSVKNIDSLEQKLKSCKIVEIDFSKDVDLFEARQYARNFLDIVAVNNVNDVRKYLTEKLSSVYNSFNVSVRNFENIDLLKARLDNNAYYNVKAKDSECISSQNHILRAIVEDIYNFDIVSRDIISDAGKVKPIKIDMQDFSDYLFGDMHNMQISMGYMNERTRDFGYAYSEKFISTCMFVAYSNLIRNQYLDNINELNLSSVKGFVDSGERGEQKRDLQAIDMSMFTIKKITGKKEKFEPKTLNDRITVMRSIRNSISHNGLLIQYAKNGNIHESRFVFTLAKHPELQIKVKCDDFLKFVSDPIFSNYRAEEIKSINANTNVELEAEIQKLLQGEYDKTNSTSQWADE